MLGDAYEFLGCKRNVAVGRTTFKNKSGERLNMLGAFSTAGFAHGDFIGFYSGRFLHFENVAPPRMTGNHVS